MKTNLLFTQPNCGNCPPVKEAMEKSGLTGTVHNARTEEGMCLAIGFGVKSTPTVIILDLEEKEIARLFTPGDIKQYLGAAK